MDKFGLYINKIFNALLTLLAWIVLPAQIISTFILGILVRLTFGLLLFPLSLIWITIFLGPLLGLSWLWRKSLLLRVPIAILGFVFVCLTPSMGESESRVSKMLLCEAWPFSWECWMFELGKSPLESKEFAELYRLLQRIKWRDPMAQKYLHYLLAEQEKNEA